LFPVFTIFFGRLDSIFVTSQVEGVGAGVGASISGLSKVVRIYIFQFLAMFHQSSLSPQFGFFPVL
jgi:hypothetical protein